THRLPALEPRAVQDAAGGGVFSGELVRAAKRRRRFGAGDKDARPERDSSQRHTCSPSHRRAPLWPFQSEDCFGALPPRGHSSTRLSRGFWVVLGLREEGSAPQGGICPSRVPPRRRPSVTTQGSV